jgi:hypothetical protein
MQKHGVRGNFDNKAMLFSSGTAYKDDAIV